MDRVAWGVSCAIGIALGLLFANRGLIELDAKIGAGHLVQAAVVLGVFLLAQDLYERLHDTRRATAEALLLLVDSVLNELDAVRGAVEAVPSGLLSQESRNRIHNALSRYGKAVATLEKGLGVCGLMTAEKELAKIKSRREEYKDLVTESPFPMEISEEIRRKESILGSDIHGELLLFRLEVIKRAGDRKRTK